MLGAIVQSALDGAHLAYIDVLLARGSNKELRPLRGISHLIVQEALKARSSRPVREGKVVLCEGCRLGGARREGGTRPRLAQMPIVLGALPRGLH